MIALNWGYVSIKVLLANYKLVLLTLTACVAAPTVTRVRINSIVQHKKAPQTGI